MRAVALLFVGFALGFGSALGLFSSSSPVTGNLEASAQPERQVAAQAERPPVTGGDMPVLIDTGATVVALRESDARRAGYRLRDRDFTVPVQTANGTKLAAPIVLRSVEIGSIRVRNVEALVSRDEQLSTNLLGISFLGRLDGFRFHNGHLVLEN